MRPPSLFGEYGLAARKRSREGGAGKGDLVRERRPERHPHADDPLPESYERMGLKQITMQPGDISACHASRGAPSACVSVRCRKDVRCVSDPGAAGSGDAGGDDAPRVPLGPYRPRAAGHRLPLPDAYVQRLS